MYKKMLWKKNFIAGATSHCHFLNVWPAIYLQGEKFHFILPASVGSLKLAG
jgi:hypothetical protein